MHSRYLVTSTLLISLSLMAANVRAGAEIVVVNFDPPGLGFNDPTPVAPVGGNAGTTLGEQRLNVFGRAAEIWGATIESPVPIIVGALFSPLDCAETTGVLGAAGPTSVFADFPGAPLANTWHVSALADSLVGEDLAPGEIDLIAFFNGDIGVNPGCLTGLDWYNGFDHENNPDSELDLLAVVSHEIAHGLGFLELTDSDTGEFFLGLPDAYLANIFDTSLGRFWTELSDAERLVSQVNTGNLVWGGDSVTLAAPSTLGARPSAQFSGRATLRGSIEVAEASFGPALSSARPIVGRIALADDGVAPSSDGCEPFDLRPNQKIALIDRGGCAFTQKTLNAQAAGARGVIIVNNLPQGRPPLGGAAAGIEIPTVGVTLEEGNAMKADLARFKGALVTRLRLDRSFSSGVDANSGLVRLFAPDPVQPGSSTSHFDTSASPNLLMEPSINDDLAPSISLDLSPALLEDTGWQLAQ